MDATMSLAPVLEISKDSIRLGGWGRFSIFCRASSVYAVFSSAVVARRTSSCALRTAISASVDFSPRWGTWTQTLCPARWVRASDSSSQSPVSTQSKISWGRMARGR